MRASDTTTLSETMTREYNRGVSEALDTLQREVEDLEKQGMAAIELKLMLALISRIRESPSW